MHSTGWDKTPPIDLTRLFRFEEIHTFRPPFFAVLAKFSPSEKFVTSVLEAGERCNGR